MLKKTTKCMKVKSRNKVYNTIYLTKFVEISVLMHFLFITTVSVHCYRFGSHLIFLIFFVLTVPQLYTKHTRNAKIG